MALTKKDRSDIQEIVQNIVVEALAEFYEHALVPTFATKADLKKFATKKDLESFKAQTENNFADVKKQLDDLRVGTPTREAFQKHDFRISALEQAVH